MRTSGAKLVPCLQEVRGRFPTTKIFVIKGVSKDMGGAAFYGKHSGKLTNSGKSKVKIM